MTKRITTCPVLVIDPETGAQRPCGAELQATEERHIYFNLRGAELHGGVLYAEDEDRIDTGMEDCDTFRVYCANDHTEAQIRDELETQREVEQQAEANLQERIETDAARHGDDGPTCGTCGQSERDCTADGTVPPCRDGEAEARIRCGMNPYGDDPEVY